MMRKLWSEVTRRLEPYVPGEQPSDMTYIKLNTNENPYSPSPLVLSAIKEAANEDLRLYPTPTCDEVRAKIAAYYGFTKSEVFLGNGSDELLAFTFLAFFNPGSTIIFPDITYSFYPVYAALFNINYRLVKLNSDFSIPVEEFFVPNGGVIFPNPNAPTGRYLELESIQAILDHNTDKVVVVDEAYIDFGGESAIKLINKYNNLLVVRTVSKSRSLAGMRVGFALGHKDLIEALDRVKNSFNSYTLDRIALAATLASFDDEAYYRETCCKVIGTRERITAELQKIGFAVVPSKANFVFITHPAIFAEELFKKLKEKGVLVRFFNKPRINNYLRVTIGSDEDMACLIQRIKEILLK